MSFSVSRAVVKTFAGNGKNCLKNGPVGSSSLAQPVVVCPIPGTHSALIADALTLGIRVADETQLDTLHYGSKQEIITSGMCVPPHTENIVYLTDRVHSKVKRLNLKNLELSTLAGCAEGYNDGPLATAKFNHPTAIETACDGRLLVICDTGNRTLRCVDFENGEVSTLCGVPGGPGKIPANVSVSLKRIRFNKVVGLVVSSLRSGVIYAVDQGNHCVIEIDTIAETGKVILGMPAMAGKIEIDGMQLLCSPEAICELPGAFLLVADTGNNCLRLIDVVNGYKCTLLNTHVKPRGYQIRAGEKLIKEANRFKRGWVDGNLFEAMFFEPVDCKFDGKSIFIADKGNNVVRIIDYDQGAAVSFDEEKLQKSIRVSEEIAVPKVYCRDCELQCRVWNGRSCDRCGSFDIFALKSAPSLSTDTSLMKNSVKNDIVHQVYFRKQEGDFTSATLCLPESAQDAVSWETQAMDNGVPTMESIKCPSVDRNREIKTIIHPSVEDLDVREVSQTSGHSYFPAELETSNAAVQELMERVTQSEQKLEELQQSKLQLQEESNLSAEEVMKSTQHTLPIEPVEADVAEVYQWNQEFNAPTSYELELGSLCNTLYDLQIDEDQYLQDLLECPFKDDFTVLNLLQVSPCPKNMQDFLYQLREISPISLIVFAFEGDDAFPVPLSVNKADNYIEFIDTEATTVCLALIGDLEPEGAFIRLKSTENRTTLTESTMHEYNPLRQNGCCDEVSYHCQGNLAEMLKMSRINRLNEYCCRVVFELADGSDLCFDILFGCGSAEDIKVEGADLVLLECLNLLEIVRPCDDIGNEME